MDRMSAAEFAARRCQLGLTMAELGERLGVRQDTVKRWEAGREPVPYRVRDEVAGLAAEQGVLVRQILDAETTVYLRRGDGWTLGAAARALEAEPDLMLEWLDV